MQNNTERLSESEVRGFKRQILYKLLFAFTLIVGTGLLLYIYFDQNRDFNKNIIYLLFALVVTISIIYVKISTRKIKLDLEFGYKDLIVKKITNKKAFEDDDPGIGSKGYVSPYWKYILISGGEEFRVKKEVFEKLEVGDSFIVPTAPNTEQIFEIRPLK